MKIFTPLITVTKQLIETGSFHATSYESSKRIILCNQIALTYILCAAPYVVVFPLMGSLFLGILVIPFIILFGTSILLNQRGKTMASRTLLFASICFCVSIFAALVDRQSGIQFVFFTLVPIAYVISDPADHKLRALLIPAPILLFYLLELSAYFPHFYFTFSPQHLSVIYHFVVANIFIILFLTIRFYFNVAEKAQSALTHAMKFYPLSQREVEVGIELSKGKSNKEISEALFIEETTVKNHLKSIFKKLEIKSRSEFLSLLLKEV